MATLSPLTPAASVIELRSTPQDWEAVSAADLGAMLTQMHLIRAFEEEVLTLAVEGNVHGPAHSSIGQELSLIHI